MRPQLTSLLIAAATVGLGGLSLLHAAPMQRAELTRAHNEVLIQPADKESRAARIGDVVQGSTAVRTGAKSRAELRFTDETLTRLGANSQFSFRTGTRNLSLDNGVLFLQVPKGAGGASIQTAAVTAAVSGTTIMMEYVKGKVIKIIIIEGTLDMFFPERPKEFITLKAGQMIMMHPDAKKFPNPVEVDLAKLLASSDLAGGDDKFPINDTVNIAAMQEALKSQKQEINKGQLVRTNLVIPGRGNQVYALTADATMALRADGQIAGFRLENAPPVPRPNPHDGPVRPNVPDIPELPEFPNFPVFELPVFLSGRWAFNSDMIIDPSTTSISSPPLQGKGVGFSVDETGGLPPWFSALVPGASTGATTPGAWNMYLLETIAFSGTPTVVGNPTSHLFFYTLNDITVDSHLNPPFSGIWNLDGAQSWTFLSTGNIDLSNPAFVVTGANSSLSFLSSGLSTDIRLGGSLLLGQGSLQLFSTGDTQFLQGSTFAMGNLYSLSLGKVDVAGTNGAAFESITVDATGDVNVSNSNLASGVGAILATTNSNDLNALLAGTGSGGQIQIKSSTGNVQLSGATILSATGDAGEIDILAANGAVTMTGAANDTPSIEIDADTNVSIQSLGGSRARVSMAGVKVSGQDVKIQASGQQALVDIKDSEISAIRSSRIFAEGSGSVLQFGGYTKLSGETVRLAGQTVRVAHAGVVDAREVGQLGIHADSHQYTIGASAPTAPGAFGVVSPGANTRVIQTNYAGRLTPLPTAP